MAKGFGDGFGFGVYLELVVDVAQVKFDRVDRDVQFCRSSLVTVTFDQHAQQASFMWRQVVL